MICKNCQPERAKRLFFEGNIYQKSHVFTIAIAVHMAFSLIEQMAVHLSAIIGFLQAESFADPIHQECSE